MVNIITYRMTCFKLCGLVFMFYTLTVFALVTMTVDKAHIHNICISELAICKFLDSHNFKTVQYHANISWQDPSIQVFALYSKEWMASR